MASTAIRGANKGVGVSQIQPGTVSDADIAAAAGIQTSKLLDGAKFIQRDGSVVFTADQPHGTSDTVSASNFKITRVADPVNPQDAATRAWVLTQVAGGPTTSTTAKAATTANLASLSGPQSVDGVSLSVGDICLVKNQTTPAANGIYTVQSGAWTRIAGMDTWVEVPGVLCTVQQGTLNADTMWLSTADAGGTLGTTPITFVQMPGPSDVIAGAGMTRTGQSIDVVAADNSMTVNPDSVQVKVDPGATSGNIQVTAAGINVKTNNSLATTGNTMRVDGGVVMLKGDYVIRDPTTATPNGSITAFPLTNTLVANTECVYLNGILQEPGAGNDYTVSGSTITFLTAPLATDRIRVNYLKGPAIVSPN